MNVQQSPRKATAEIEQYLHEVDRASGSEVLTPPSYGEEHRKAIDACIEGLVSDVSRKMEDLHMTLKAIEQRVLQSAERTRSVLREHAAVCSRVNDEVKAMKSVIADLAEQAREP